MANEHLFRFRLAAPTYEGAQPDPNASLGGFQSVTALADQEGSFTAVTSDRVVTDTGLPGDDFEGAWIVFLDTNLNEVRQIIDYNTGTKTMTFAEDLPSTPLVSDRYWLFVPNGFFDAFDADLCRRRPDRYRLAYVRNQTGGQLDSIRTYVRDIQAGPLLCEVAMAVSDTYPQIVHFDVDDIANEETAPVLLGAVGGAFGPAQDFYHKRDYDGASQAPFGSGGVNAQKSMRDEGATPVADRPLWLRLTFDTDSPIPLPSQAVFQIFVDSDDGVTTSSFLVVIDLQGVPEEIITTVDRRLRIAGGARLSAFVRDSVAPNEAVPGRSIRIELDSGPGSMNAQSDSVQRDDDEPIRRVYLSPTDPVEVGQNVTFSFEVT